MPARAPEVNLPRAVDSERAVIAAFLVDPGCRKQIFELVNPEHCYHGDHTVILKASFSLLAEKIEPDLPAILARAAELGHQSNGLRSYLSQLLDFPAAMDIEHHAGLVREAAERRNIIILGNELIKKAQQKGAQADLERLLETFRDAVSAVVSSKTRRPKFELVRLADIKPKPHQFVVDGLIETDSLVQIYGDPGAGKSLLAVDIACCAATGAPFTCTTQAIWIASTPFIRKCRRLSKPAMRLRPSGNQRKISSQIPGISIPIPAN